MSEVNKDGNAEPTVDDNVNAEEINHEKKEQKKDDDVVAYHSYSKVVGKNKTLAEKLAAQEAELEALRQEKAMAEGNKDKVIDLYKSKVESLSQQVGNFAYSSLSNQVRLKAQELGCIDSSVLMKTLDLEALSSSVDKETFTADDDVIAGAVEKARKDMPFLFNKPGPNINNKKPGSPGAKSMAPKSVAEMTPEEQKKLIDEIDKQAGKAMGKSFL